MKVKTEIPHLVKDTSTGALLNTNASAYQNFKIARQLRLEEKSQTEKRFERLEGEMSEIKSMLTAILEATVNK